MNQIPEDMERGILDLIVREILFRLNHSPLANALYYQLARVCGDDEGEAKENEHAIFIAAAEGYEHQLGGPDQNDLPYLDAQYARFREQQLRDFENAKRKGTSHERA